MAQYLQDSHISLLTLRQQLFLFITFVMILYPNAVKMTPGVFHKMPGAALLKKIFLSHSVQHRYLLVLLYR